MTQLQCYAQTPDNSSSVLYYGDPPPDSTAGGGSWIYYPQVTYTPVTIPGWPNPNNPIPILPGWPGVGVGTGNIPFVPEPEPAAAEPPAPVEKQEAKPDTNPTPEEAPLEPEDLPEVDAARFKNIQHRPVRG
jgi:hypothetical protein